MFGASVSGVVSPSSGAVRHLFAARPAARTLYATTAVAVKKHTYNVEVVVGETEPEDVALRRFRRAVMASRLIPETRRRQFFENPQDIKKRKVRERALIKRMPPPKTWEEVMGSMEPAPFADMFGDPEDIFAEGSALFGIKDNA